MPNFMRKLAMSLLAVLAICAGATAYAAAPASPAAGKTVGRALPPGVNEKLVTTKLSNGSGGSLAASTFNTIDTQTVSCTKATCTIGFENMIQLASPDGFWAICPEVDGNLASPPCPYQGSVPAGGSSYVTGGGRSSVQVAHGTHTLTTTVYTNQASSLANWEADYRVYAP